MRRLLLFLLLLAVCSAYAEDDGKALIEAVKGGRVEEVKKLLRESADLNVRGRLEYTPLLFAIDRNHPEIVRLLLAANADVDTADDMGATPLMLAATVKSAEITDPELIRRLIDLGADLDLKNDNGNTALDIAVAYGWEDIQETLREAMK